MSSERAHPSPQGDASSAPGGQSRPEPEILPPVSQRGAGGGGDDPPPLTVEVGDFRPGTPATRATLALYLVGRAVTEAVGIGLAIFVAVLVGLAVVCGWVLHSTLGAVVFVIAALIVLLLRWLLLAVLRRLTAAAVYGALADRLRGLVRSTRGDLLRELRRNRLPGRSWTLPLLALRLLSRTRRPETVRRLRGFQLDRVVPTSRVDELHLLVQSTNRGG